MRSNWIPSALTVLLLFAGTLLQAQGTPHPHSRAEFAAAMGKIMKGVAKKEIWDMLGKPDDIRTQFDPGGISRVHTKEIWCYGTDGHLSFPTLGCVYIDEDGRSQEAFGGDGHPPDQNLFKEDELRNLLRLLNTAPGLDGYSYNPLPLIQIVNTLQPMGKEKALAAIGEYLRVSDPWSGHMGSRSGIFLVLRVLFDVPDNIDPDNAGGFGMPSPAGPKDPHRIPRFPIALVDDIPLMLVSGYALSGMATPMDKVLGFFRDNGKLHPQPLTPSNYPFATITHLMNSTQWIYEDPNFREPDGISFGIAEDSEREKSMLMEQLLRLIDSVYRMPEDVYGNRLPCGAPPEPAWQKVVSKISALGIKWDSHQNMYVFQNGKHLPKVEKAIYRRQIWKLDGLGFEIAELVLERKSDMWVDVTVSSTEKAGVPLRPATLLLFDNKDTRVPMETFSFDGNVGKGSSRIETRTIGLRAGTELTAKLVVPGDSTNLSPVLKP